MFNFFSNLWAGTKELWDRFEAWVAGWVPSLKTKLVSAATVVAGASSLFAEYLKTVDLSYLVNAKTLSITMIVLGTLTFWLRGLGDRVEAREEAE
jgi:hypothetical protein